MNGPVYEAIITWSVEGRRIFLLQVEAEDQVTIRGRWVTVSAETRGFRAVPKAEVSERVPMVLEGDDHHHPMLVRADRGRRAQQAVA